MVRRVVSSPVALALLAALAAGCADDEIFRRGEAVETTPTPDVLLVIEDRGVTPAPEANVEARAGTVIWHNRMPSTCVTVRVKGARLVSGPASTRLMAQEGPDIVSTAAIPPGGVAAATIDSPGDYPYEIHGPTKTISGVLRVRPTRGTN